jgi:hypothetical protein
LPRPCPHPHPLRQRGIDHQGDPIDWAPCLEMVGAYADSCWFRCRKCGAWFWAVTDRSRFTYCNEWQLPTEAAELALRSREVGPIVTLLIAEGLPHGPMWTSATARIDLLRHMTPGHDDRERIAALQTNTPLDEVWTDALALLLDAHAASQRSLLAPALGFVVDLTMDVATCDELFEIPGAVIAPLDDPPRLLRFTPEAGVALPVAGPARLLARQPDSVIFMVEAEPPTLLVLRPETMLALPSPTGASVRALALDRGHYLLIPAAASAEPRTVELRDDKLEFVASLRLALDPASPYPCAPRAMGSGWVFSSVINDAGAQLGLCLFDERWQVHAYTELPGARSCDPIDESRLLAVPLSGPRELEGWRVFDNRFERSFTLACHAHARAGERLVVVDHERIIGTNLAGKLRWRVPIEQVVTQVITLGPRCVLVRGPRWLGLIDPETGKLLDEVEGPISEPVLSAVIDHSSVAYALLGATLLRCGASAGIERTLLDGDYELVSTAGAGVVVRQRGGTRHLWIAGTGELLGGFDAAAPLWSVLGSGSGPHVLERGRLRIHQYPSCTIESTR